MLRIPVLLRTKYAFNDDLKVNPTCSDAHHEFGYNPRIISEV